MSSTGYTEHKALRDLRDIADDTIPGGLPRPLAQSSRHVERRPRFP